MTGRDLPAGGFAGDRGAPDAALDRVLAAHERGEVDAAAVVGALADARVLVPVVAVESAGAAHGADMSLVTLGAPDGRRALPVFSSTERLSRWRPQARPVPVEAVRAALSAVDEGCDLLVLDPAGPVTVLVRRPAVWALARSQSWVPSWRHPEVAAAFEALFSAHPGWEWVDAAPGDVGAGGGSGAELVVTVSPRAAADEAEAGLSSLVAAVQADETVRRLADSVAVRVRRRPPAHDVGLPTREV